MSFQKNTVAGNSGTAGNVVGDAISQAAGLAQAALDASADSDIHTDAQGGSADAELYQDASAEGAADNTSFGDFNVSF